MLPLNLKTYREKMELTQKQIAEVLNIDRSTYSYYETGKSIPPVETLKKLAKIFNITIDTLLGYESNASEVLKDDSSIYLHPRDSFALLSEEEQSIIMKYRQLPADVQEEIHKYINSNIEKQQK